MKMGFHLLIFKEELDEDGNVINVRFKDAQEDTTIDKMRRIAVALLKLKY